MTFRNAPFLIALVSLLAACADMADHRHALSAGSKRALSTSCLVTTPDRCGYDNAPLVLGDDPVRIAGRRVDFFALAEPLFFQSAGDEPWTAPVGTLTDGASIPPALVPLAGDPRSPEFAPASALHDAYCGIGNEAGPMFHAKGWRAVHLMFHDALLASGTPRGQAQLLFAAVWIGGPRWGDPSDRLTGVSDVTQRAALVRSRYFIDRTEPDTAALVAYLDWLDGWMRDHEARRRDR